MAIGYTLTLYMNSADLDVDVTGLVGVTSTLGSYILDIVLAEVTSNFITTMSSAN